MNTAKLFVNGSSQAVRLPKECRFEGKEVFIKRINDMVIMIPKNQVWSQFTKSLDGFTEDFMATRTQPELEQRQPLP